MRTKLIARLIKYLLKALLWTCKIEKVGYEKIAITKDQGPLILMLWHNRLAPLAEILLPLAKKNYRFAAFVSKSRDGEILSQFVLSYKGGDVIRVPHNGRDKALKVMIETLLHKDEIVLITPDGPRGPVHELKPGVLFAAQESKAAIIPFSWEASSYFELKTWDKFRIPKPFTTIRAVFGEVIHPNDETTLEELQTALESVSKQVV